MVPAGRGLRLVRVPGGGALVDLDPDPGPARRPDETAFDLDRRRQDLVAPGDIGTHELLDQEEQEDVAAPVAVPRGRVQAPAASEPLTKPPVGRPRLSEEQKATNAAVKAAAPPKPRTVKVLETALGASAKELRAALKEVEVEASVVKEAIVNATVKFQPKIDALRSKHAELSAQLAAALFK